MRAIIKLILFGSLCLLTYILMMMRFILPNPNRRHWRASILKNASKLGLAILGVRLKIIGQFPKAPFTLVTNHLSYVDMFILASQSGCIFVAKQETASWPVIGPFIKSLGTIFINRQNARDCLRVEKLIEEALLADEGIVIFPEGTSSPGSEVLPFKAALLRPAAVKGFAVWAGSIFYRTPDGYPPAHMSVSWWGDMEFWPHWIELLRLPFIEAHVVVSSDPVNSQDHRQLARLLEAKVKQSFQPTLKGERHESRTVHQSR